MKYSKLLTLCIAAACLASCSHKQSDALQDKREIKYNHFVESGGFRSRQGEETITRKEKTAIVRAGQELHYDFGKLPPTPEELEAASQ